MGLDEYHLAQVNIAVLREPIDSPLLAGFVAALGPVNALADASPGFLWRLQTADGDATAIRAFDDQPIIVNMSVWESRAALQAFVLNTHHRKVMVQRREWFHKMSDAYIALWWVRAGHIPTVAEADDRIRHLRGHGPTDYAFDLRHSFPAPEAQASPRP